MKLKQLRKLKQLTQKKCAQYLGMPLRTYQNYENDPNKINTMKYQYIMKKLEEYGTVDEIHGLLSKQLIEKTCQTVLSQYKDVDYCYLFGSYAKDEASEDSDVDLFISTSLKGLKYFGLVEQLREQLNKNVDVLNQRQLEGNTELAQEILKDGIKVYEKARDKNH